MIVILLGDLLTFLLFILNIYNNNYLIIYYYIIIYYIFKILNFKFLLII
jgi:hypothetical protein